MRMLEESCSTPLHCHVLSKKFQLTPYFSYNSNLSSSMKLCDDNSDGS